MKTTSLTMHHSNTPAASHVATGLSALLADLTRRSHRTLTLAAMSIVAFAVCGGAAMPTHAGTNGAVERTSSATALQTATPPAANSPAKPPADPVAEPPANTPASTPSPTPAPDGSTTPAKAPPADAPATGSNDTKPADAKPADGRPGEKTEIGPIFVTFVSKSGSIKIELFPKEAPRTCANFLNLIRRGYYISKTWDDFSPVVRQLGTPIDLSELPYKLPREFSPKHLFDKGGLLCLANTTEDERARGHPSRVFITVKPQERWNLVYPVFGQIREGLDVAESLIPGEHVAEVRVEGDADALLAKYAKQVAEWNAILDKTPMR